MAARGTTLLAGGVVVGAAIGLAIGGMATSNRDIFGNTTTDVVLMAPNGPCELGKETIIVVQKNKQITWHVKNGCAQAQTVVVGNFRTVAQTDNGNCDQPTAGGATSPFQQDDLARRTMTVGPGDDGDIKLKVKSREALGDNQLTYYYSFCLGQTVVDPTLIIER
jgi:hypothetical protein